MFPVISHQFRLIKYSAIHPGMMYYDPTDLMVLMELLQGLFFEANRRGEIHPALSVNLLEAYRHTGHRLCGRWSKVPILSPSNATYYPSAHRFLFAGIVWGRTWRITSPKSLGCMKKMCWSSIIRDDHPPCIVHPLSIVVLVPRWPLLDEAYSYHLEM